MNNEDFKELKKLEDIVEELEKELEIVKREFLLANIAGDQKLASYYEARIHNTKSFIRLFKKGEEYK